MSCSKKKKSVYGDSKIILKIIWDEYLDWKNTHFMTYTIFYSSKWACDHNNLFLIQKYKILDRKICKKFRAFRT